VYAPLSSEDSLPRTSSGNLVRASSEHINTTHVLAVLLIAILVLVCLHLQASAKHLICRHVNRTVRTTAKTMLQFHKLDHC
jgi:hypothetical protein